MPANTSPIFPITPVAAVANISSAITTRTVTGVTGLTSLKAAGSFGTRIDRISIRATATTTAGTIRIWLYDGSGNANLIWEEPVYAVTPSATLPAFSADIVLEDLVIPSGKTLYVSTEKAEAFNVIAFGGDY